MSRYTHLWRQFDDRPAQHLYSAAQYLCLLGGVQSQYVRPTGKDNTSLVDVLLVHHSVRCTADVSFRDDGHFPDLNKQLWGRKSENTLGYTTALWTKRKRALAAAATNPCPQGTPRPSHSTECSVFIPFSLFKRTMAVQSQVAGLPEKKPSAFAAGSPEAIPRIPPIRHSDQHGQLGIHRP